MSTYSPFLVMVLNIFAGIIGGVTVNLFSNNIDIFQILSVLVVGCITYYVIAKNSKKQRKEND